MKTSLKIEDAVQTAGVSNPNARPYRMHALTTVIMAVSSITTKAELGVIFFPEELNNDGIHEFLCHGSNRFFEAMRLSDRTAFHLRYNNNELILRINVMKGKRVTYIGELNFQAENKFDDGKFKSVTIRRDP